MDTKETTEVALMGRTGVYRILQNVFGNEPNQETIQLFIREEGQAVLNQLSEVSEEYQLALGMVFQVIEKGLEDESGFINILSNDFTRLFVGPGPTEAGPWESAYLNIDGALFQQSTLKVRQAYVAQGMIPSSYPNAADDHIGIELDFMANLAEKMANANRTVDIEVMRSTLASSELFLDEHLLIWVPLFTDRLKNARHGSFYGTVADLLSIFLKLDRLLLEEINESLLLD